MREYGGFEHNLQSLRVVDELEERYADFPGLNLTFECREGILKHCSLANARHLGELGERFLRREQPGLEAQLANLADEIAYNNHDVDDGVRAELITVEELCSTRLFAREHTAVAARYPDLPPRRMLHEVVRRMINHVVTDVIRTTSARLGDAKPADIDAVRRAGEPLVAFSEATHDEHQELKRFLRERVYRHFKVLRMTSKAGRVVKDLWNSFIDDPLLMPGEYRDAAARAESEHGASGRARIVADYIAGMTDRYAILEHRRLFDPAART
jgi:dGTPase